MSYCSTVGLSHPFPPPQIHTCSCSYTLYIHTVFEGESPKPGQLCDGEDSKCLYPHTFTPPHKSHAPPHTSHTPHTPLVRIYHRRGARRWKKVRRINGHSFVAKRFQTAFCEKCEDRIWGLGRQGYRCESCKMTVHKRCCYFLKTEEVCKGHPVSAYCVWVFRRYNASFKLEIGHS